MKREVTICDICNERVAKKKCRLCKRDICEKCGEEVIIGTTTLFICKSCSRKIENVINYETFWDEFNKNENMEEKIIEYINKNLILKGLEDEEDEDYSIPPRWKKRRAKKLIGRIK